MSCRSTIYYGFGIHIYKDVMSGQICVDLNPPTVIDNPSDSYGDMVMEKQDLINMAHDLNKYLRINPDEIPSAMP